MIGKLTEGNITRALIKFSIPMILGNLLQQLYNVADTFIVGHYIGTDALAAVGSSFTIMTISSFFIGTPLYILHDFFLFMLLSPK